MYSENRSTVVLNGARRILNGNSRGDALLPFPTLFLGRWDLRQSKPKGLEQVKTSKLNSLRRRRSSPRGEERVTSLRTSAWEVTN